MPFSGFMRMNRGVGRTNGVNCEVVLGYLFFSHYDSFPMNLEKEFIPYIFTMLPT